jgi:hypothetical protein
MMVIMAAMLERKLCCMFAGRFFTMHRAKVVLSADMFAGRFFTMHPG